MKARRAKQRSGPRTSEAELLKRLKHAERRLRRVEERYEIAMGAINEGVYDWDIAKDRIFYSENVQRAMGLPPEMLRTPEDWRSRIHPEDLPRYRAAFVAHFKGATERFDCDYRYRALDGTWRWARQHGIALRDASGRAVRMVGSTGDITALKQAEDSLRKSEERYALATSAAVEGIYEWDVETNRLFLTERAKAFFSFPAQEPTPGAWNARIHADDYRGYRAALIEHFKGRTPQLEHEYRIAGAHGRYKWVLDRGIGVRDAGGRVTKMIGALSDITQRKQAEIELRRARDQAEEALEQQTATADILRVMSGSPADVQPVFEAIVRSGVRLFEGAGVTVACPENGQVQLMAIAERDPERSRRWKERFPFPLTRQYMHGVAILDCRMVDMPDVEQMDESFAAGKRNFAASGYRAMTVVPMVKEGTAIGTIAVVRDAPGPLSDKQIALLKTFADQAVIAIENVRLFNEIREKTRQLEIASRHKSEFVANMSHELRTPLNAIIGFTRIVMRRSRDRLEALQYENLEKILASGQHLLALINSILDLSKIEAGRIEVHPGHVGLAPVLEQCARTVEPLVKADAVSLVKEFDHALPEMYVDEEKLRQIVINLLSNAAKFTEHGSIRLRARAANGSVVIAVADTGAGIPADKLDLIFEEFEQVDASSTRVHGGTGLGLTIARRLARLMGGDIAVESAPGSGSTFTLTLPVYHDASA